MVIILMQFLACAAVIVWCGVNLSKYGDVIAERTRLGGAWIGLVLMAGVTSLPELVTGISSITIAGAPDIAVGDVMGSCVFNLALIALLDLLHGDRPLFTKAEHGHILTASFGIVLLGTAALAVLAGPALPPLGALSAATPVIAGIYLVGVRSVFLFERRHLARSLAERSECTRNCEMTLRQAVGWYVVNALLVVGAAIWLPVAADRLAVLSGLGRSFVGSVLVAMSTSLPEMVVSVAALRIGAADMAIANLLGSNMFNMIILAVDDIVYRPGPLLAAVSPNHALTAVIAIVMTGIVVVSLTYRSEKKTVLRMGWDALALVLGYLLNVALMYALRGRG